MTTISKIAAKLHDPVYRTAFVASQINVGIPFQIRSLMKARGWTQAQLAEKTDMLQPRISGLMTPGKTRPNIETLRRVAEAFDCALLVRFAPFSELARWSEDFDPESFDVPEFTRDEGFSQPEQEPEKTLASGASGALHYLANVDPGRADLLAWEMLQAGNQSVFVQAKSSPGMTLKQLMGEHPAISERQTTMNVFRIDSSPLFSVRPDERKEVGVAYTNAGQTQQRVLAQ